METSTAASESSFSNGVVQRYKLRFFETMINRLDDVGSEPEVALARALSSKNALQNKGGYSHNQFVIGCNVNLPNALADLPLAFEPIISSDIVSQNLQAIHAARQKCKIEWKGNNIFSGLI